MLTESIVPSADPGHRQAGCDAGCPADDQGMTLASLRDRAVRDSVSEEVRVEDLLRRLNAAPDGPGVLVIGHGALRGAIWRDALARLLARPFALEIHKRLTVGDLLARWDAPTLVLSADTGIADAVRAAFQRPAAYRYAPVVVTADRDWYLLETHLILVRQCEVLSQTLDALESQRQATQAAEAAREQMHRRLVEASREAGRAEVATGVLHNIGNVLNSVNASANLISRTLRDTKLSSLDRALKLVAEHENDLGQFVTADERGKALPRYLVKLNDVLSQEHTTLCGEVEALGRSIEHIKQVVSLQQSYAKGANVLEPVRPADLFEDALRVNMVSCDRHHVRVMRNFADLPPQLIDRHKILQILINLISNAKNATKHQPAEQRQIDLIIERFEKDDAPWLRFSVADTGVGIPRENLTRIFTLGFTTREDGHGFGLHSAANAAGEMGGALRGDSDGPGRGARFTLEIPVRTNAVTVGAGQ